MESIFLANDVPIEPITFLSKTQNNITKQVQVYIGKDTTFQAKSPHFPAPKPHKKC